MLNGVFFFGGSLCYMGPCSSSLAHVCIFGVLRCLEGACLVEPSLFLLICLLLAPPYIMSFVLLIVCWVPVGRLFLLRDRESVSSCNLFGLLWCFSGVPGVRGALLFWSLSLVGRALLIQVWESVLWVKFGFGLFYGDSFGGLEVERWWKRYDLSDVAQFWC